MSETFVNQVTIDCLLNKEQYQKHLIQTNHKVTNKKDKKFYKKRIYNLTKELLTNNAPNKLFPDVKYAFENYVKSCVHYFKAIDSNDILQEDYKEYENIDEILNMNGGNQIDVGNMESQEEANNLLMRKITMPPSTLDGFVKRKTTQREKNIVLPKQKEVNLKDPILKNKGITEKTDKISKKKNVDNNYENKNEKNENEKEKYNIEIKNENTKNETTIQKNDKDKTTNTDAKASV
jgi:hypothetical protein